MTAVPLYPYYLRRPGDQVRPTRDGSKVYIWRRDQAGEWQLVMVYVRVADVYLGLVEELA